MTVLRLVQHYGLLLDEADYTITAISGGWTVTDKTAGRDGTDTLVGGDGNDTLTGGSGVDSLTGGAGADTFVVANGDTGNSLVTADSVTDFQAADFFDFAQVAGSAANYTQAAAADFAAALVAADLAMNGTILYAAYDIGADVVVFADTNGDGTSDQAIILTGVADLTTIGFGNFI